MSRVHFARCVRSLYVWAPKSSGVSRVLNPPSSAPASHLLSISVTTISNTSCYSYFLFLYLITTITVFHQQPRISATLFFCCFKITVTRQRSISAHIFFFLTEYSGVYLDSILQDQFVICGSLSSLAFTVDFRLHNSFSPQGIYPAASIFNAG